MDGYVIYTVKEGHRQPPDEQADSGLVILAVEPINIGVNGFLSENRVGNSKKKQSNIVN